MLDVTTSFKFGKFLFYAIAEKHWTGAGEAKLFID